ncbi:MAG: glycosyltransferase family 4 protein [Acidimicrobiales bacterium]|jgi:glycosyltransferase involved in cell wall biosynthesis
MFGERRHRALLVILNWRDLKHPDAGGAEMVCERLARSSVVRGYEVVLLSATVHGECRREKTDGYMIIRRGGRFTVYPWALLWLALHRNQIIGVIDSQNGIPFFSPLALRPKTPVLMLLHHIHQEQFALYFSPFMAAVGRWLERYGSRFVYRDRSIVAVSPSTRARARRTLGLKGDIVVIPPGTDAVVSDLASRRRRSEHQSIVCVGRLVAHKCTASIINAIPALLAEFPHVELHLVGDGPERSAIEALVESLGLSDRIILHGPVSSSERDRILRTAWMSVNASEGEGWGLSVVEANAAGVPVLAYRRPGLRDSIRDGETGWLIDESQDLSSAIGYALRQVDNEEVAVALGQRTRQWASQFTWEKMADQVLLLLAAEAGRLAQSPNDRRTTTDLATVVRMPVDLIPDGIVPTFRDTDVCEIGDSDLVVLLRNTDTDTARSALQRAGFSTRGIVDERLQISVARHIDLVSPTIPASTSPVAPDRLPKNTLAG